jgi:hypothetical protein
MQQYLRSIIPPIQQHALAIATSMVREAHQEIVGAAEAAA